MMQPLAAPPLAPASGEDRATLMRRARLLAWGGNAWHVVEFAIAIGAGLAASSIALIGFGLDSLVEVAAGTVIVWLFSGRRIDDAQQAERRAQQLIALCFFALSAYIAVEATRDLIAANHPDPSWVGIGLAAVTAPTMPLLARAKRRVGHRLGSSATVSESAQTQLCAYLSVALLVGLGANAVFGLWWADPLAALVIAGVAVREGRHSWRGDACGCAPPAAGAGTGDGEGDCCTNTAAIQNVAGFADPGPAVAQACSLGGVALASRLEDWSALRGRALVSQTRDGSVVTSSWRRAGGVRDELVRLVDAERICCPFLSFEITDDQTAITLRTTFPEGISPDLWHSIG